MRILLRFGGKTLGLPARTEGIGELGDGENAFAMLLLPFLGGHAREETQVILLKGHLPTVRLKLTLRTMLVQHQRWWCMAGLLRGDLAHDSLGHVQSIHPN